MPTLNMLEQRKHDLRCEMVKLREDRNPAQMVKVFAKLRQIQSEIVATEVYFGVAHNLRRA